IQGTGDTVVAIIPQLRGDEELLAGHLAGIDGVLDGAADLLLIAVNRSRIDVAIARGDRGPHGVVAGLTGQLEGTKAQLRDLPTVVHGQQRDGGIIVQVLSNSWHASLFTFFHPTPLRPSPFGKILSAQKRRLHSRVSTPRKHRTPPTSSKGTDDRDSPPRRTTKQILRRPPR